MTTESTDVYIINIEIVSEKTASKKNNDLIVHDSIDEVIEIQQQVHF